MRAPARRGRAAGRGLLLQRPARPRRPAGLHEPGCGCPTTSPSSASTTSRTAATRIADADHRSPRTRADRPPGRRTPGRPPRRRPCRPSKELKARTTCEFRESSNPAPSGRQSAVRVARRSVEEAGEVDWRWAARRPGSGVRSAKIDAPSQPACSGYHCGVPGAGLADPLDRLYVEEPDVGRVGDRVHMPPPGAHHVQHATRAQRAVTLVDQPQEVDQVFQDVHREDDVDRVVGDRQGPRQVRLGVYAGRRAEVDAEVARLLLRRATAQVQHDRIPAGEPTRDQTP